MPCFEKWKLLSLFSLHTDAVISNCSMTFIYWSVLKINILEPLFLWSTTSLPSIAFFPTCFPIYVCIPLLLHWEDLRNFYFEWNHGRVEKICHVLTARWFYTLKNSDGCSWWQSIISKTPSRIFWMSCFRRLKWLILGPSLLAFSSCYRCPYSTNTIILVTVCSDFCLTNVLALTMRHPAKALCSSEAIPAFGLGLTWIQWNCCNGLWMGRVWDCWFWPGSSFQRVRTFMKFGRIECSLHLPCQLAILASLSFPFMIF